MLNFTPSLIKYIQPRISVIFVLFILYLSLSFTSVIEFSFWYLFALFLIFLYFLYQGKIKYRNILINYTPYFTKDEIVSLSLEIQKRKSAFLAQRIFDLFIAILLIPFFIPIAFILIFLIISQGKRPIFIQNRHGLNDSTFKIYKITTLCSKTGQTLIMGKWIRLLGLDEIPQLWNVLKGDMSLVGPRPEMLNKMFSQNQLITIRLSVKPGLTGYWQLSPYRNQAIESHLEYDVIYALNRGLWLDLTLIVITPFFIGPK